MSFAKIRPRRGTASEWSSVNPILAEGEEGIEVPESGVGTGKVKIKYGDGVKHWNDLPYGVVEGLSPEDILDSTVLKKINDYITPQMFGAKGDGITYDTEAFQLAVNEACDSGKTLYIPSGDYIISNIVISKRIHIKGAGINQAILRDYGDPDIPLLYNLETNNISNSIFEDFKVFTTGNRTDYTLKFVNSYSITLDRVNIQNTTMTPETIYHGVYLGKVGDYTGLTYLQMVRNCFFGYATLVVAGTDSLITNNLIYGYNCESGIKLINASNTTVSNNEICGGKIKGAVYVTGSGIQQGIKITNNSFDGAGGDIDTKYGLISDVTLQNSVISDNNFWKQKSGGIKLSGAMYTVINGNSFQDCDYYLNGVSDIEIGGASMGCVISSNTFYREYYFDKTTNTHITRPSTNPAPIMNISNLDVAGVPYTLIYGNTMSLTQYFDTAVYTGNISAFNNSHTKINNNVTI